MIEEGSFHFQEGSESWMDEEDIRAYVTDLPDDREMEANGEVQRPVQITSATEARTAFRCLGDRSEVQVNMRALCMFVWARPCVRPCMCVRAFACTHACVCCVRVCCVCVCICVCICVYIHVHTRAPSQAQTRTETDSNTLACRVWSRRRRTTFLAR
jgi:hypothetical protein